MRGAAAAARACRLLTARLHAARPPPASPPCRRPQATASPFAARRRMRAAAAPAAAAAQDQPAQAQPGQQALPASVAAFLDAFGQRSVEGMAACLSLDASYSNLSLAGSPFAGRAAAQAALAALVRGAPPSWRLLIDDAACTPSSASVVWHFEDGSGRPVPFGRGLAFYRLDSVSGGRVRRPLLPPPPPLLLLDAGLGVGPSGSHGCCGLCVSDGVCQRSMRARV